MDFWDDPANVQQYIEMCEGYDGSALIAHLAAYLHEGAELLEIGMGPGTDLALLACRYRVTGSDRSAVFVQRHLAEHPDADVLQLDASTLATERTFDGLYSNKVLHHLSEHDFAASLQRQARLLRPGGIAFHSLWCGDEVEEIHGMRFQYHTPSSVQAALPAELVLEHSARYEELAPDDSLWVVLRRIL